MSQFVDFLTEVFARFGPIQTRKMFGGYGVYCHGTMFGLVADDNLYLKADATTAHHFESLGLAQFEYDKGGKLVKMSYYLAPAEIFDDPEQAATWARRSLEVALRRKKESGGRKKHI